MTDNIPKKKMLDTLTIPNAMQSKRDRNMNNLNILFKEDYKPGKILFSACRKMQHGEPNEYVQVRYNGENSYHVYYKVFGITGIQTVSENIFNIILDIMRHDNGSAEGWHIWFDKLEETNRVNNSTAMIIDEASQLTQDVWDKLLRSSKNT